MLKKRQGATDNEILVSVHDSLPYERSTSEKKMDTRLKYEKLLNTYLVAYPSLKKADV